MKNIFARRTGFGKKKTVKMDKYLTDKNNCKRDNDDENKHY